MALCVAALLAACGGGGGGASPVAVTPTPPPVVVPVTPACAVTIVADTNVDGGKTAGASAMPCTGNTLADISWTQVSGPAVTLLASHEASVAFESASAGVVRLKVDVTYASGTSASATADINIGPVPVASYVTVRADHSVRSGVQTSLRAWPVLVGGDTLTSIVWSQVAGPTVAMDSTDQRLLTFTVPRVTEPAILTFRAVLSTSSGRVDQDDATVYVEPQVAPSGALFDGVARVHAYRQASPYAASLARCSYDIGIYYTDSVRNNFCPVSTLPLLEHEAGAGGTPSVAQVMDRVAVSHDFLGANFEAFLQTQDVNGDFRRMLAGVTTIIIGSHVRPSYYYSATGAIYLDAGNLWLTPEQRDVVTEVPDYRLAFADALAFSSWGRLVKNNDYANRSFPVLSRLPRTNEDLVYTLGKLLYHELGHAADFIPPANRSLDPSLSVWSNISGRIGARTLVSDVLAKQYPLTSREWKGLGQVLYQGATANAVQKAYTAAQVGAFFAADVASDDYAYSIAGDANSREDLAMLMEEFMMGYRHGVQYDGAYADKYPDGTSGDLILVRWGERGRIAEPGIKPRIKLVLARIAPWIDPASVDALAAPILFAPGVSWNASLVQGTGTSRARKLPLPEAERTQRLRDEVKPQPGRALAPPAR